MNHKFDTLLCVDEKFGTANQYRATLSRDMNDFFSLSEINISIDYRIFFLMNLRIHDWLDNVAFLILRFPWYVL